VLPVHVAGGSRFNRPTPRAARAARGAQRGVFTIISLRHAHAQKHRRQRAALIQICMYGASAVACSRV